MKEEFKTLKFFYLFAHGLRKKFLSLSILLFLGKICLTFSPILAGWSVDKIHHHASNQIIAYFIISYIFLRILEPIFLFQANKKAYPLIHKTVRRIMYWGYTKLWNGELEHLAKKDPLEIKNIWEQARTSAIAIMSICYLQIFPILLEFLFYFIIIGFFWDWLAGFLILLFAFSYVTLSILLSKYNSSAYTEVLANLNQENLLFGQSFLDFETVKAWGLEKNELQKQEKELKSLEKIQNFNKKKSNISDFILSSFINLSAIFTFLWASLALYNNTITSGFYATIMLAMTQIFAPLKNFCWAFREVNDKLKAMRIFYLTIKNLPQEETLLEENKENNFRQTIVFKDVTLGHQQEALLENINLELPYGQKIAILGSSGEGKTSLARSLIRLFPIKKGEIYFGETPLSHIPLAQLRNKVLYVSQDSFLRATTIRENLILEADFPETILIDYMKKMNLSSLINRLDDPLAQRGFTLSLGQRTRISLLRALVRNPDVIILDEPIASLDKDTAKEILSIIQEHFSSQTVILIVHSVKHLKWVDKFWLVRNKSVREIRSDTYKEEKNKLNIEEKTHEVVNIVKDNANDLLNEIEKETH